MTTDPSNNDTNMDIEPPTPPPLSSSSSSLDGDAAMLMDLSTSAPIDRQSRGTGKLLNMLPIVTNMHANIV